MQYNKSIVLNNFDEDELRNIEILLQEVYCLGREDAVNGLHLDPDKVVHSYIFERS